MTISETINNVLLEKETDEVTAQRSVPDLLKLTTFQGMTDDEIYSIIDYLATQKANIIYNEKVAESEELNIKKTILYKRLKESTQRFNRLQKKHLHYAITNGMGEIVGYTDDTEETE